MKMPFEIYFKDKYASRAPEHNSCMNSVRLVALSLVVSFQTSRFPPRTLFVFSSTYHFSFAFLNIGWTKNK